MANNLEAKIRVLADTSNARTEIRGFEQAWSKTMAELGKTSKETAEIRKLAKEIESGARSTNDLDDETKRLIGTYTSLKAKASDRDLLGIRNHEKIREEIKKVEDAYKRLAKESGVSNAELKSAATSAQNKIAKLKSEMDGGATSATSLSKSTGAVATGFSNIAKAAAAFVAARLGSAFFETVSSTERLKTSLKAVFGEQKKVDEQMAFIKESADTLGASVLDVGNAYTKFAASAKGTALEGENTRRVFSAFAGSMAQLGASSADLDGALTQLGQVVTADRAEWEDMKSIIDRIPGSMGLMAKAVGVSADEFKDFVSQGKLGRDEIVLIGEELGRVYDTNDRVETLAAGWERFNNTLVNATTEFEKATSASDGTNIALDLMQKSLTTVVSGFIGLGKYIGAAAFSVGQFYDFVSGDLSWDQLKKNSSDAFGDVTDQIGKSMATMGGFDDAAKKAADSTKKIGEEATASEIKTAALTKKLEDTVKQFDKAIKGGASTEDALKKLFNGFENKTADDLAIIVQSTTKLKDDLKLTDDELNNYLRKSLEKLSDDDLKKLEKNFLTAFESGKISAKELDGFINQKLIVTAKKLKVDITAAFGGFASGESQVFKDLDQLKTELESAGKTAKEQAVVMAKAMSNSLSEISTSAGMQEFINRLDEMKAKSLISVGTYNTLVTEARTQQAALNAETVKFGGVVETEFGKGTAALQQLNAEHEKYLQHAAEMEAKYQQQTSSINENTAATDKNTESLKNNQEAVVQTTKAQAEAALATLAFKGAADELGVSLNDYYEIEKLTTEKITEMYGERQFAVGEYTAVHNLMVQKAKEELRANQELKESAEEVSAAIKALDEGKSLSAFSLTAEQTNQIFADMRANIESTLSTMKREYAGIKASMSGDAYKSREQQIRWDFEDRNRELEAELQKAKLAGDNQSIQKLNEALKLNVMIAGQKQRELAIEKEQTFLQQRQQEQEERAAKLEEEKAKRRAEEEANRPETAKLREEVEAELEAAQERARLEALKAKIRADITGVTPPVAAQDYAETRVQSSNYAQSGGSGSGATTGGGTVTVQFRSPKGTTTNGAFTDVDSLLEILRQSGASIG